MMKIIKKENNLVIGLSYDVNDFVEYIDEYDVSKTKKKLNACGNEWLNNEPFILIADNTGKFVIFSNLTTINERDVSGNFLLNSLHPNEKYDFSRGIYNAICDIGAGILDEDIAIDFLCCVVSGPNFRKMDHNNFTEDFYCKLLEKNPEFGIGIPSNLFTERMAIAMVRECLGCIKYIPKNILTENVINIALEIDNAATLCALANICNENEKFRTPELIKKITDHYNRFSKITIRPSRLSPELFDELLRQNSRDIIIDINTENRE